MPFCIARDAFIVYQFLNIYSRSSMLIRQSGGMYIAAFHTWLLNSFTAIQWLVLRFFFGVIAQNVFIPYPMRVHVVKIKNDNYLLCIDSLARFIVVVIIAIIIIIIITIIIDCIMTCQCYNIQFSLTCVTIQRWRHCYTLCSSSMGTEFYSVYITALWCAFNLCTSLYMWFYL